MSGTFQARVQSYLSSSYSETTNLSDNLTAGAKQIVDLLPESKLDRFGTNLADGGSGVTVTGHRVIRAHKGGYRASRIDPGLKTQAATSGALSVVAIVSGGSGYALNDVLTLSQGTSGTCTVTGVAATVVTAVEITTAGSAFTQGVKTTTVAPAGGTNCTLFVIPSNSSIYEATTTDPAYYIENAKGYVLPGGGTIVGMAYPTVAYGDSTISNFPTELEHGVVLYAVIQGCMDLLNDSRVALAALSYTTPATVPSAPADSSYSYTDATLGTYTATTIGSLGTAPNYTAPTATIDGTVWATAYPNYATTITTALSAITTQVGNGVTAQANVAALLTSIPTAIGLGNAEVDLAKVEVAKMAAEVILADAETAKAITEIGLSNTEVDKFAAEIALADAEILEAATNVDAAIDTATAAIVTANGRINTAVALANAEFDKIATIISEGNTEFDKIAAKLATASTTISTNEELAKGQAEIQQSLAIAANGETYLKEAQERYNNGMAYLEEAKTSLQEAQGYIGEVNARVSQVQGQLQVAQGYHQSTQLFGASAQGYSETAKGYLGTSQKYLESAQGYLNVSQGYIGTANGYFTEAQKDLELALAYSQSTQTYIGLAQAYASEVQARLANVPAKVSEFNATVNNAFNSFTKELEIYKSTAQSAIRQAELDQERLMLNANKTTDLSVQNKAQTLNASIALYKDKLEKFMGQLQLYASQIQDAQIKYSLDQAKYQAELNHYTLILNSAKKEFEDYLKGRL